MIYLVIHDAFSDAGTPNKVGAHTVKYRSDVRASPLLLPVVGHKVVAEHVRAERSKLARLREPIPARRLTPVTMMDLPRSGNGLRA